MKPNGAKNHLVQLSATAAIILLGILFARAEEKKAAPQKPRCDVRAGQKSLPFQARSVDGKTINFPADYKGKLVLLDFWATWCPPCRKEIPEVVSTYQKYHTNGLEIVGISMDLAKKGPELLQFIKDNNMTWPQVYDGGANKAALAVKFGVHAIPCPILIDADTGIIIAAGSDALSHHMKKLMKTALAKTAPPEKAKE